jgi:hypothetical protein
MSDDSLLRKSASTLADEKAAAKDGGNLMQNAPLRYLATPGRNATVDALAPVVQSWFADTVTEPIPEALAAILQRM